MHTSLIEEFIHRFLLPEPDVCRQQERCTHCCDASRIDIHTSWVDLRSLRTNLCDRNSRRTKEPENYIFGRAEQRTGLEIGSHERVLGLYVHY